MTDREYFLTAALKVTFLHKIQMRKLFMVSLTISTELQECCPASYLFDPRDRLRYYLVFAYNKFGEFMI